MRVSQFLGMVNERSRAIRGDWFFNSKTKTESFNGDLFGADQYLRANIENRLFIGKNVCHNVHYTPQIHERLLQRQRNKFMDLFLKSMDIYLAMHPGGKKLHDPTAAACLLHPEIGTWIRGKLIREKDQWRTLPDEGGDHMLVDLQYEELWDRLLSGR